MVSIQPCLPHQATLLIKSGYPRIPANSKEQTMSNQQIVISGVGLWTPPHQISNEELVVSYNAFADRYNAEHQAAIEAGELAASLTHRLNSSRKPRYSVSLCLHQGRHSRSSANDPSNPTQS